MTFFLELDSDLHKSMGAFNWEFKTMELRAQNAQLAGGAKMVQRICRVFDELRESYQELKKSCENPGSSDLTSPLSLELER